MSQGELIEPTGQHHYQRTARWAEYFHRCAPTADGLIWIARQFDTERAIVLFGDRVGPGFLADAGETMTLDSGPGLDLVLALAEEAGLTVVR